VFQRTGLGPPASGGKVPSRATAPRHAITASLAKFTGNTGQMCPFPLDSLRFGERHMIKSFTAVAAIG